MMRDLYRLYSHRGTTDLSVEVLSGLFFLLESPCMRHRLVLSGPPMPSHLKVESMAMSSDAWSYFSKVRDQPLDDKLRIGLLFWPSMPSWEDFLTCS